MGMYDNYAQQEAEIYDAYESASITFNQAFDRLRRLAIDPTHAADCLDAIDERLNRDEVAHPQEARDE